MRNTEEELANEKISDDMIQFTAQGDKEMENERIFKDPNEFYLKFFLICLLILEREEGREREKERH